MEIRESNDEKMDIRVGNGKEKKKVSYKYRVI